MKNIKNQDTGRVNMYRKVLCQSQETTHKTSNYEATEASGIKG